MAPSEISVPKLLTAARGSTFILVLVSTLFFKFTHTMLIILPFLAASELGIEHLLGMVRPVTLSTLDYHMGLLVINIPLTLAWFVCNLVWRQPWASANAVLADIVSTWMVVVAFIIHISIGAVQAREEIKRQRRMPETSKEIEVDIEEKETTAEHTDTEIECEKC